MCGILGAYNCSASKELFVSALKKMEHRGPDAEGIFNATDNNLSVWLGHRRLSIIDLSTKANQPFEKNEWVITYNGEIYNYKELYADLVKRGVKFLTHSDTEVILEAWKNWGPDCLKRFRGMFSFSLFNKKTKTIYLARDPFGIKPLFYYSGKQGFIFASEIKALLHLLGQKPAVNYKAVVASLLYVWVPGNLCVYEEIHKFPQGYWAEYSPEAGIKFHCYWDLREELSKYDLTQEVSIPELQEVIQQSVKVHMESDVPVSTFLSGGLDSSLITVLAAREVDKLHSYTINFRRTDKLFEAMPDDPFYAKKVANKFGICHHEIEINPDMASLLPSVVSFLGEPIGDSAAINTFLICKAARELNVKVILSGMGADEIFGGYRKQYACLLASKYRRYVPKYFRENLVEPFLNMFPVAGSGRGYRLLRWAKRFINFAGLPEESAFRRSYTYYGESELKELLIDDLWPFVDELIDEHAEIYNEANKMDQVNRMCYTDFRHFLPGLNLTYTDRASMAASTEVRVPFIDKEVILAAFRISGRRKIANRSGKLVLKKASEKWLPKEIIYRPKAPFMAPLRSWIRNDLKNMVDDMLGIDGLLKRNFLKPQFIRQLINNDRSGKEDNAHHIWQLLTLEQWFKNYSEKLL